MKDAADKRQKIEKEQVEALAQLREKQAELNNPIISNHKNRQATLEAVEALQVSYFCLFIC